MRTKFEAVRCDNITEFANKVFAYNLYSDG